MNKSIMREQLKNHLIGLYQQWANEIAFAIGEGYTATFNVEELEKKKRASATIKDDSEKFVCILYFTGDQIRVCRDNNSALRYSAFTDPCVIGRKLAKNIEMGMRFAPYFY